MTSIAYLGNFSVPFSTESHISASMEQLGHEVIRLQEGDTGWPAIIDACRAADVFWWTQTYGLAERHPIEERAAGIDTLNSMLPTVAQHLDLWFGLERAHQVAEQPYFRCRLVCTADGDHDDDFVAAGVNHRWLPPGVYGPECIPGVVRRQYRSDVAFVGSHRGGYHDAWWPHRKAMLDELQRHYRGRVQFWPRGQAVRGQDLNDLYASTKVTVGDSCFADSSTRYFSDRAFETVGRGGFLVMPWIEGLAEMLLDGEHCRYFEHGNHAEMRSLVDFYVRHDSERERIRHAGQQHVAANHTYAHRVADVLNHLALEPA